jgi:hypothetical protein
VPLNLPACPRCLPICLPADMFYGKDRVRFVSRIKAKGDGWVEFERPLPYDVRRKWKVSHAKLALACRPSTALRVYYGMGCPLFQVAKGAIRQQAAAPTHLRTHLPAPRLLPRHAAHPASLRAHGGGERV